MTIRKLLAAVLCLGVSLPAAADEGTVDRARRTAAEEFLEIARRGSPSEMVQAARALNLFGVEQEVATALSGDLQADDPLARRRALHALVELGANRDDLLVHALDSEAEADMRLLAVRGLAARRPIASAAASALCRNAVSDRDQDVRSAALLALARAVFTEEMAAALRSGLEDPWLRARAAAAGACASLGPKGCTFAPRLRSLAATDVSSTVRSAAVAAAIACDPLWSTELERPLLDPVAAVRIAAWKKVNETGILVPLDVVDRAVRFEDLQILLVRSRIVRGTAIDRDRALQLMKTPDVRIQDETVTVLLRHPSDAVQVFATTLREPKSAKASSLRGLKLVGAPAWAAMSELVDVYLNAGEERHPNGGTIWLQSEAADAITALGSDVVLPLLERFSKATLPDDRRALSDLLAKLGADGLPAAPALRIAVERDEEPWSTAYALLQIAEATQRPFADLLGDSRATFLKRSADFLKLPRASDGWKYYRIGAALAGLGDEGMPLLLTAVDLGHDEVLSNLDDLPRERQQKIVDRLRRRFNNPEKITSELIRHVPLGTLSREELSALFSAARRDDALRSTLTWDIQSSDAATNVPRLTAREVPRFLKSFDPKQDDSKLLIVALHVAGLHPESAEFLEQLLERDATRNDALWPLTTMGRRGKQLEHAVPLLTRLLERDGLSEDVRHSVLSALIENGSPEHVLAGCETGRANPDRHGDDMGLAHATLAAGARCAVASLWMEISMRARSFPLSPIRPCCAIRNSFNQARSSPVGSVRQSRSQWRFKTPRLAAVRHRIVFVIRSPSSTASSHGAVSALKSRSGAPVALRSAANTIRYPNQAFCSQFRANS